MSQSNKFAAKRVDLLALEHIAKRVAGLGATDAEQSKRYKDALQLLTSALEVDPNNKADQYKYGLDASLAELVSVATETFGSSTSAKATSAGDVFHSAKFYKYLDLVKKKGAFDGLGEEGSPQYEAMLEKVKQAFVQKFEPAKSALSPEEAEKRAEELKLLGNEKLTQHDFAAALDLYTQAIDVCPNGPNTHIFLSNRAAAYTHLKDFERACADCQQAILLKPDFSKAHSRLAHAQLSLGNHAEAKASAERSLELDPTNGVAIATLEKVRAETSAATKKSAGGMGGGFPGFPGMGGGGGMPDLSSMLNNPMMAQMMKDPQMMAMAQQMASDPNAMKNLMGMMGGGKQ